jgi:pectate lyase
MRNMATMDVSQKVNFAENLIIRNINFAQRYNEITVQILIDL